VYKKSPILKLERAEHHIRDLQSFWRDEFIEKKRAYRVSHKDDAKAGYRIYRLDHILPIPPLVSLLLGDAVHNLRSAMDHLAYLTAFKFTRGVGPFGDLYFPVGEDAPKFEKALLRSQEHKSKTMGVKQRLGPDEIKAFRAWRASLEYSPTQYPGQALPVARGWIDEYTAKYVAKPQSKNQEGLSWHRGRDFESRNGVGCLS
jgi:hypothetical protein